MTDQYNTFGWSKIAPRVAMLRIQLLGDIRIEWAGRAVDLPRRAGALRLLVRLLLSPNRLHPRESLAFALWPDVAEADALSNLRRHLHLLRASLPGEARDRLHVSARDLGWIPNAGDWCDMWAFEAAAAETGAAERAAVLYEGELAPSLGDDEAVVGRRESLRQRYASLLKELAWQAAQSGAADAGQAWARKLLDLDPWDEESVRLKMTLQALAGNRQSAIETYQALASSLQTELDTLPLPETMALYADLVHNRSLSANRRQAQVESAFVGRRAELRQLEEAFARLSRGHGQVIFVSGEAGAGKTALLREVLHRSAALPDPVHVYWGHCRHRRGSDTPPPYEPWRQILMAAAPVLVHSSGIQPALLNALVPLVPDLSTLRPDLLAPTQPNAGDLQSAIRQAVLRLAGARPLILVIEDAHWGDPASLELIAELAETCSAQPVLLLVTQRVPDDGAKGVSALKRSLRQKRCASDCALAPFTPTEVEAFVSADAGARAATGAPLTGALVSELAQYSGGLPLLLREALDSLSDALPEGAAGRAPLSLRAALKVRVERLGPEPRAALDAAAVLGFSVLERELQAVLGWPDHRFEAALDPLLARRWLVSAGHSEQGDYAFSHHLVHDVLLEAVTPVSAGLIHAAAARTLERLYGQDREAAGRIARHYDAAGDPERAAPYWLRQAEAFTDLAAFAEARSLIDRALLAGRDPAHPAREILARASVLRATLAHYEGRAEDALALLAEALPYCRAYPTLTCQALTLKALVLSACDRWQEGLDCADEASRLARAGGDVAAEAAALNLRGICRMMLGQTREAVTDLDLTLEQLERSDRARSTLYAQTLNHLGTALVFVQEYPRAEVVLQRTVALTRSSGLRRLEAAALTMLGQVGLNRGRYGEAIDLYTRAIDVVGEAYVPGLWGKHAGRGAALLRRGDAEAAKRDFQQGLAHTTQLGTRYGQTLMAYYLTTVELARRGPNDCESLAQIEAAAARAGIHPVLMGAAGQAGHLWRLLGDLSLSYVAHERAWQAAERTAVPTFLLTVQAGWLQTRALGEIDVSLQDDLRSVLDRARATGEAPSLVRGLLAQAELRGRSRDLKAAVAACEEASVLATACPDQPLIAEAHCTLAGLLSLGGDRAGAQRALARAREAAEADFWPLLIPILRLEAAWTHVSPPELPQLERDLRAILGAQGSGS
ncbi:MAG TPA: AAA family ATPase [Anaerolineales bacterium]|nr:AAA family ATPase [Anaerolineales bacterium]